MIKGICEEPIATIIFNGERLELSCKVSHYEDACFNHYYTTVSWKF